MHCSSNSFLKIRFKIEAYFFYPKKIERFTAHKIGLHDSLLLPTMAMHLHLAIFKALHRVVGAISLALKLNSSPRACLPFVWLHHRYILPPPYRGFCRAPYPCSFYFFYTLPYRIYFRCAPKWHHAHAQAYGCRRHNI